VTCAHCACATAKGNDSSAAVIEKLRDFLMRRSAYPL
jgi:hypothetical protein